MASQSNIVAILKASKYIPPEVIEKIDRLAAVTPNSQFFEKLTSCGILHAETVQKLQELVELLGNDFPLDGESLYGLSEEKKKDIIFARQVLNEGLCTLENINECFMEQANQEKKSNKLLQISQIMVKRNLITVERFVTLHREIEQKLKATNVDEMLTKDATFRIAVKNNTIQFLEVSIPEHFGPYRIIEEIARGGMGVVYKAYDSKLKRHIALKVLKAWENPPLEEIQRFHREARLAARLNHTNIVNIYDAGVEDGVHYFTMDYVEGEALSKRLGRQKLSPREALIIAREIALALEYAHAQGVIHRDVKPDNIILDLSNRPLLTDFGLAKGTNVGDSRHLTQSGAALGTPAYMSPEQAQGAKINKKSDIYSLGAVLYEMLTGRPPFEGDSVGVVISEVISKDPVLPLKLNPDLHPDIEKICLKAMAKDRDQRYESAEAMAKDIDRFLSGDKVEIARSSAFIETLSKHITKPKVIAAASLLLICLFAAIWIVLLRNWRWKEARELYEKGDALLKERDYQGALFWLRKASEHTAFYEQAGDLLANTGEARAETAIKLLQDYEKGQEKFEDQYEKGLTRFRHARKVEDKGENLKSLELLKEFDRKNRENFLLAVRNFREALACNPANEKAREYLGRLYLEQLALAESRDEVDNGDWYLDAARFYHFPSKVPASGDLFIQCSPPEAKGEIHLFALEEHYLNLVPIGWRLLGYSATPSAEGGESGDGKLAAYLEKHYWEKGQDIELSKESELGIAPTSISLSPGYYLVIGQCEGFTETRAMVKIIRGKQLHLTLSLPPSSPLLKNYCHISIPNPGDYYYFLSKNEVTWKEYSEYSKKRPKQRENEPVAGISYQEAEQYCKWLTSRKTKGNFEYSMPTLEIWQQAAGMEDGRVYPWGNYFDWYFVDEELMYLRDENQSGNDLNTPPLVGPRRFDVSPYGLNAMGGGVREWCYDEKHSQSVICGGSFRTNDPFSFQIQHPSHYPAYFTQDDVGFRIMARVPKNFAQNN